MPLDDLWVIIAAYNEAEVIGPVVAGLLPTAAKVVVVDDGSRDDTARMALRAGAIVLSHPVNLGQGAALATGIQFALERGPPVSVLSMKMKNMSFISWRTWP